MLLTLNVVTGDELQNLINSDDREGKLQYYNPLVNGKVVQLEDHLRGKRVGVRTAAKPQRLQQKASRGSSGG